MRPSERFQQWLHETTSPWLIGQLAIQQEGENYQLCHQSDLTKEGLQAVTNPQEWRKIVFFNDKDEFRPLKASADFATGWTWGPLDFRELLLALQYAYPALVAEWAAYEQGQLPATSWQETAERQTGRFKVVAQLSPEQQEQLVRENCAAKCTKHLLWSPGCEIGNPPLPDQEKEPNRLPLLCPEACNFLVGKAREILKGPMD